MTFDGTCKNCFFGDSCPYASPISICEDYIPLTYHTTIEDLDDKTFEKLYGYGAPLRLGE